MAPLSDDAGITSGTVPSQQSDTRNHAYYGRGRRTSYVPQDLHIATPQACHCHACERMLTQDLVSQIECLPERVSVDKAGNLCFVHAFNPSSPGLDETIAQTVRLSDVGSTHSISNGTERGGSGRDKEKSSHSVKPPTTAASTSNSSQTKPPYGKQSQHCRLYFN
ncbi:unnamed protein product [Protopolystoma xenopodis]|uniref:Uncharacterized protein n=1 Tax=Protopolystoma xenopodis TaxID=117903 RepID=A0A3S5AA82_9PLAT|nr:unnamed protein product [Protopolystoma xenopodis]